MQPVFHIHINGLVQGVGFRPFVYRLATEMNISGTVSNTNDGVHIEVAAGIADATAFYNRLLENPPQNAVITHHSFELAPPKKITGFQILHSTATGEPDLLLTPDIAICGECSREIMDPENKRFGYAFTTCLNCGPRYSISRYLPYDREHTSMADLPVCASCLSEYNDIHNRRFYSQTNSCPDCAIRMHLYDAPEKELVKKDNELIEIVADAIAQGKIVAVKAMGGFLLICDACNENAVLTLRARKHRPAKPFALLYADIKMAGADVYLHSFELAALKSKAAPIVLCRKKFISENNICADAIAPGLDKTGVMLPSTGLLQLIAFKSGRPLVATSGNISGAPVIYKDEEALLHLFDVADLILTYDREILTPQDDSVIQFADNGQQIIVRRGRGLAPNYFPNPFLKTTETILAAGAELKAAFALLNKNNLYISQYLGDQGTVESQECYQHTLNHFELLLQTPPQKILVDKHPGYAVSQFGKLLARKMNLEPVFEVQHHRAHVAAVLAEHQLLYAEEPVLGFAWDGTGYGDDGQIWGGEIFYYCQAEMTRIAHLKYFPQLLADKMSKEPRLAALSLVADLPEMQYKVQPCFSKTEWQYYLKVLTQDHHVMTSSMGRFLDGIACILGVRSYNSYEGEAAMQLEALARNCYPKPCDYYPLPLVNDELDWHYLLQGLFEDIGRGNDTAIIARKVFYSLAKCIVEMSSHFHVNQVAFSGGVFQNALLVDLIYEQATAEMKLYFHRQLSPNDECIGLGQLACYETAGRQAEKDRQQKKKVLQTASYH